MGNSTERVGVHHVAKFFAFYKWIFREQTTDDYGVDAHVETIDKDGKPTGKLIAIQIKSGESYFKSKNEYYTLSISNRHIQYWTNHSLPVIIILVNPQSEEMFWQHINYVSMEKMQKNWKIKISKENILNEESLQQIEDLSNGPLHIQKLNKLRLDRPLMEFVNSGERIYIEFYDWINKSLPRFDISLKCDSEKTPINQRFPFIYGPRLSVEDVIKYILPWAEFRVDDDDKYDYLESIWSAECYCGYDKAGVDPVDAGQDPLPPHGPGHEPGHLKMMMHQKYCQLYCKKPV